MFPPGGSVRSKGLHFPSTVTQSRRCTGLVESLFVRTVFTCFCDELQVAVAENALQALPLHDACATCGTTASVAAVARKTNLRVTRTSLSDLSPSTHMTASNSRCRNP